VSHWLITKLIRRCVVVANQTYVRTLVPVAVRGRATSLMGGTGRVVSVIGPMYGGFISVYVSPEAAFYSRAATSVAAGILVLYGCIVVSRRGEDVWSPRGKSSRKGEYEGPPLSLCRVYRENWRAYATIGVVAHCLMAIRTARKAVVPLIGRSVGLDVDGIGLAMAAGATTDAALFAPTGVAFDKLGRKRVAVPALAIFTLGYVFTSLSRGPAALVAASTLVGIGNGMTAGFGQIMAADLAPDPPNTAKFLSIQSMCSDSGSLQAPIVVGALSDMLGATAGGFYCAGLSLLGLVWLAWLL
jgi:MFS family permease